MTLVLLALDSLSCLLHWYVCRQQLYYLLTKIGGFFSWPCFQSKASSIQLASSLLHILKKKDLELEFYCTRIWHSILNSIFLCTSMLILSCFFLESCAWLSLRRPPVPPHHVGCIMLLVVFPFSVGELVVHNVRFCTLPLNSELVGFMRLLWFQSSGSFPLSIVDFLSVNNASCLALILFYFLCLVS